MNNLVGVNAVVVRPNHEAGDGQDNIEILLIKRKFPPFNGKWALPGGMLKKEESFLEAMKRELKTETGLELKSDKNCVPLETRSKEGRDPRGHVNTHPYFVSVSFEDGEVVTPGENVSEARWFLLSEIEELAFDHGAILCEALGLLWEGMPSFQSQFKNIKIDRPYKKSELKDNIVLYPGSFNPWHEGHRECLKLCPNQNILIVPDVSPWKTSKHSSCAWKRYNDFCQQLIGTSYSLYPGFVGKETSNPTFDWLPKVAARDKWLLIGDDNFLQIESWKNSKELLLALKGIYVVSRSTQSEEDSEYKRVFNSIHKSHPKLKIEYLEGNKSREVSSTKIRSEAKS